MTLIEQLRTQGSFLFKYRSYLPLILLGIGLVGYTDEGSNRAPSGFSLEIVRYVALGISLVGFTIRVLTVGYTPQGTSGRNTQQQLAETLNMTGLYSIVRHPLYLGNFIIGLGIALLTMNGWFVFTYVLMFWLYYERIIVAEEHFLNKKFGSQYVYFAAKTNTFWPNVIRFQKPELPFSWKKVLKKEKNGFFAIFLTFFLFEAVGVFKSTGTWWVHPTPLTYGMIISGVAYFVLRMIKHRTTWLEGPGR